MYGGEGVTCGRSSASQVVISLCEQTYTTENITFLHYVAGRKNEANVQYICMNIVVHKNNVPPLGFVHTE